MIRIAGLLARWGMSEAKAARFAPVVAAAGVLVLLAALWPVYDHFNDRAAIKRDRIETNAKVRERQLEAAEKAARERLRNDRTNRDLVEAYTDAINHPEPGDHVDPGVRLACEQLRRDGQDTSGFPECGGR